MSVIPLGQKIQLNNRNSRETHNRQHAFLTHNPFWKDSNKTPEFKMAKQHLGFFLEALVLGHSNPWARSDLSFAPPNGIHEMPDRKSIAVMIPTF